MAVYGISMVKDEADVIEGTIRHMAGEVDHVLVADNGSSDGTRDILDALERELPLTVVDDPEPAYYQSVKMTALAQRAAEAGAEWVVPFDGDELWTCRLGRIADVLGVFSALDIAQANLYHHYATALDPSGTDPFQTMPWRIEHPAPLPKVAFRWQPGAVIHQGNHGVDLPRGGARSTLLTVHHFPYRSADQFVRKGVNGAAAYALTDLPADQGAHWRSYGDIHDRLGPEALADVFREHFWYRWPEDSGLVYDPAPYRRWERRVR